MTGMETKRARGKCIANALFVSFAELSCSVSAEEKLTKKHCTAQIYIINTVYRT